MSGFGWGEKQKAEQVTIYWLNGEVEVVRNVVANQVAVIWEEIGIIKH